MPKTVKQMWDAFEFQASRKPLNARLRAKLRASYYAGCHGMLEAVLAALYEGEPTSEQLSANWKNWANELTQFSDDWNAGRL